MVYLHVHMRLLSQQAFTQRTEAFISLAQIKRKWKIAAVHYSVKCLPPTTTNVQIC
jgi:hypothetical protein